MGEIEMSSDSESNQKSSSMIHIDSVRVESLSENRQNSTIEFSDDPELNQLGTSMDDTNQSQAEQVLEQTTELLEEAKEVIKKVEEEIQRREESGEDEIEVEQIIEALKNNVLEKAQGFLEKTEELIDEAVEK